jgi:hypothetical protein
MRPGAGLAEPPAYIDDRGDRRRGEGGLLPGAPRPASKGTAGRLIFEGHLLVQRRPVKLARGGPRGPGRAAARPPTPRTRSPYRRQAVHHVAGLNQPSFPH